MSHKEEMEVDRVPTTATFNSKRCFLIAKRPCPSSKVLSLMSHKEETEVDCVPKMATFNPKRCFLIAKQPCLSSKVLSLMSHKEETEVDHVPTTATFHPKHHIPLQAPPALRFTVAPPSEANVRAVATNTPLIEMAAALLSIPGATREVPPRETSAKGKLESGLKSQSHFAPLDVIAPTAINDLTATSYVWCIATVNNLSTSMGLWREAHKLGVMTPKGKGFLKQYTVIMHHESVHAQEFNTRQEVIFNRFKPDN